MLSLSVFTLRSLGDIATLMIIAKRHNIDTLEELQSLVDKEIYNRTPRESKTIAERRLAVRQANDRTAVTVPCSICNGVTRILPVNDTPATQIDGDYKSCALCYACKNVDYYKESVAELIKKVAK